MKFLQVCVFILICLVSKWSLSAPPLDIEPSSSFSDIVVSDENFLIVEVRLGQYSSDDAIEKLGTELKAAQDENKRLEDGLVTLKGAHKEE